MIAASAAGSSPATSRPVLPSSIVSGTPPERPPTTGRLFHDGSVAKLEDAVKLMASGGIKNKNLNPAIADRGLTPAELGDLIAFLGALDCPGKLEEPKVP
jgi:hypothetical protein